MGGKCSYGGLFFLFEVFFHLFESKWLYEYEIRWEKIYIYFDRTNFLVLISLYLSYFFHFLKILKYCLKTIFV